VGGPFSVIRRLFGVLHCIPIVPLFSLLFPMKKKQKIPAVNWLLSPATLRSGPNSKLPRGIISAILMVRNPVFIAIFNIWLNTDVIPRGHTVGFGWSSAQQAG